MTKQLNNITFTNDIFKTKAIYLTKMTTKKGSFMYCQITEANFKHYA